VPLEVVDLAKRIAEAASEKQASDVVLLDTRKVCSFADYFIICSGESERQIQAIGDAVAEVLAQEGVSLHHREGDANSGWVLLDLGDIIVHIFSQFEREYYQLEKLWSKAPVVVEIM
jgi:ribosome-associated protein